MRRADFCAASWWPSATLLRLSIGRVKYSTAQPQAHASVRLDATECQRYERYRLVLVRPKLSAEILAADACFRPPTVSGTS